MGIVYRVYDRSAILAEVALKILQIPDQTMLWGVGG